LDRNGGQFLYRMTGGIDDFAEFAGGPVPVALALLIGVERSLRFGEKRRGRLLLSGRGGGDSEETECSCDDCAHSQSQYHYDTPKLWDAESLDAMLPVCEHC